MASRIVWNLYRSKNIFRKERSICWYCTLIKKERILLELVAHTGGTDVREHINRAKVYRKSLKETSTYVIHFTTSPKINEYPFSMKNDEVSVLHVHHSPSFDVIKLYQHKGEEPVSMK